MSGNFKKSLFPIVLSVSIISTAVPAHPELLLDDGNTLTIEPLEAPEADALLSSSDTISYDDKTQIKEENDKDISLNEAFVKMQASSSGHWEEKVVGYVQECQCGQLFNTEEEINQHQYQASLNGIPGHHSAWAIPVTERVWVEDPEPDPGPETDSEVDSIPANTFPMYRLYNPYNGEHFYSSNSVFWGAL